MKRKPTVTSTTVTTAILAMADIASLPLKEACATFAERALAGQRAFAEMGKLHHAIHGNLKPKQTIYGELRKLGVKDSTTSNASYASRVWAEVIAPGHLAEADYDGFTFADCRAICKATGGKSARRLTGEEVALIVRAQPESFDLEITSIYETGQTVAEAAAQAAATEAKRVADEAAAAQLAAEQAETARLAAAAADLERERLAAETPAAPPVESAAAASGPSVSSVPASAPAPAVTIATADFTPAGGHRRPHECPPDARRGRTRPATPRRSAWPRSTRSPSPRPNSPPRASSPSWRNCRRRSTSSARTSSPSPWRRRGSTISPNWAKLRSPNK